MHELVVCDPRAERVDTRQRLRFERTEQYVGKRSERSGGIEQPILVRAAVDDIDRNDPVVGMGEEPLEANAQVLGAHERQPESAGDRAMLVVGRVRRPVGEHDDRRLLAGLGRCGRAQSLAEPLVGRLQRAHAHAVRHR